MFGQFIPQFARHRNSGSEAGIASEALRWQRQTDAKPGILAWYRSKVAPHALASPRRSYGMSWKIAAFPKILAH